MRRRGLFIAMGLIILVVAIVGMMGTGGNMARDAASETNTPPHAVVQ